MRRYAYWFLIAVVGAGSGPPVTWADCSTTMVCRKSGIVGCEREAARALEQLGSTTTSDIEEAVVFVMKGGATLYAHSNYVNQGADYPVKMAVPLREGMTLASVALNMAVWTDAEITSADRGHAKAFLDGATFVLDRSVLSDAHLMKALELHAAANLYVAAGAVGVRRQLRRLDTSSIFLDRIGRSLYVKADRHEPSATLDRLRQQPVDVHRLRLVSFELDSATRKAVAELPKEHVVAFDPIDGDLPALFQKHAGDTIALLGHFDDSAGEYVIEDAAGNTRRRVSIKELDDLAVRWKVTPVYIGCFSAMQAAVGAGTRFNSLYAIERFLVSREAGNLASFLEQFSSPGLLLVVDGENLRISPPASPESPRASQAIRVAEIYMRGRGEKRTSGAIWVGSLAPTVRPTPTPRNPEGRGANRPASTSSAERLAIAGLVIAGTMIIFLVRRSA